MLLFKKIPAIFFAFLLLFFSNYQAKAEDCGNLDNISIANMTWPSASLLAEVMNTILKNGYGCEVEIIPGDTVPTASGMTTKGKPDIAPELWVSSIGEILTEAYDKGVLYEASDTFANNGFEAFWIPSYTAEKYPDLKTIDDLKKYAHLFTEISTGNKGRIYGCPPGWACEIYTANLFKAYELGSDFELFSPGSGSNLQAAIARAVKRKKDIVAYYWEPTAVIGRYGLVPLKMDSFDTEKWSCVSQTNCENPKRTSFAASPVKVVVSMRVKQKAPDVAQFLGKFTVPNKVLNDVLAWADKNSASAAETANYFMKNKTDIWSQWLPSEITNKIKSSI